MRANRNGRALEYCLTQKLQQTFPNMVLSPNSQTYQERDKEKFFSLSRHMQNYYQMQCHKFTAWLKQEKLQGIHPTLLERLSDGAARKGDVTDIRLTYPPAYYNISLKHKHYAVKHQRPGALFKQLGIQDKQAKQVYRQKLKHIEQAFFANVQQQAANTNHFKTLKSTHPHLIKQLYHHVCHLVEDQINHRTQAEQTANFFTFLIGNTDFDKVIISEEQVEILSFQSIPTPTHIAAHHYDYNRIELEFDNGFTFDMRIHTASSRFQVGKSISLKFDTQLMSDNVPTLRL